MRNSIKCIVLLWTLLLMASCEKENVEDEFSHLYGVNLVNMTMTDVNLRIESELIYLYQYGELKNLFTYEIRDGVIITDTDESGYYLYIESIPGQYKIKIVKTNILRFREKIFQI